MNEVISNYTNTINSFFTGLISVASIIIVVIVFLLDHYAIHKKELPTFRKAYKNLIKLMVLILVIVGITLILCWLYIILFTCNIIYYFILILFGIIIVTMIVGTSVAVCTFLKS